MFRPSLFSNPAFRHLRTALYAAAFLITPLVLAQAPFEIRATVDGRERDFEASENEVLVVRKGDRPANQLRDLLTSGLEGAIVTEHTGTHAFVRLPRAFDHAKAADRKDAISALLPDAEIRPVVYPKGLPHTESTRHVVTRDLLVKLPAGKTAAQLVADAGATGSETTIVADYVLLRFASPYRALDGARKLRAAGAEVRPQLARAQSKRAVPPLDEFFPQQWHLFNIGQGGGVPGVDASVLGAWDVTLGTGINIAIVDDGLQTNHPDLRENCPDIQSNLHHDFIDVDNDPRPAATDSHGTAVGGVAAARQNNGTINPVNGTLLGVSGSAPEAKLIGLRLIAGPFTDLDSANALYWKPLNFVIGVSNNSWGPFDGSGVRGPDVLTKAALEQATAEGRGGNGQITVFASGNGNQVCCGTGPFGLTIYPDNSNLDGYANSRFVLAVGAVDNTAKQSFYSEPGANIMVVAPSDGGTLGVTTTDQTGVNGYNPQGPGNLPNTDYTNDFGGTSAAAPLTAGGVALMLASSSDSIGWRDVKEILAGTARQVDPGDPDWVVNGGGFRFNHKYGGGMIDLRAAVIRARTWANLGTETSQTISLPVAGLPVNIPDGPNGSVTRTFDFTTQANLRLEQIEIVLDISHQHRSDLTITLTSPSGVQSVLFRQHARPILAFTGDDDIDFKDNGAGWTFTSTRHWGDNSLFKDPATGNNNGIWTLTIRDQAAGTPGSLNAATVRLWGTLAPQSRVVFESATYSLSEAQVEDPANPGQFINARQRVRIKRLGPMNGEATVDYATTLGTATPPNNPGNLPADFTPVTGTAHFSDGQQFADQDIFVEALPDAEPEASEQINLVLNNPVGASLGGVTLTTIDVLDSSQNFVTVASTDNTASETNFDIPVDWGTFTITRQTPSPSPLTVHFNITGTATYDDGITPNPDYLNIPLIATIPAFETSIDITVAPVNDSMLEGVETVILNLEGDAAYAIGDAESAQINIVDNDRQKVQIVNLDNQAKEDDSNNTGRLQITRSVDFSAPNAFDEALSVDVSLGGTQRPRDNYMLQVGADVLDLGPETQTLTVQIPAGMTTLDLFIKPVDDNVYQATKTVVIGLRPNPSYDSSFGFLTGTTVRIIEDDPVPDTVIPTVRIDTPLEGEKIFTADNPMVTASGIARDNISVQRVSVQLNGGATRLATLEPIPDNDKKVRWSLDITPDLVLGQNVMTVQSRDGDLNNFNDSAVASIHFKVIEKHQLTVQIDGAGRVTNAYQGTTTQKAGASFDITAKPDPGNVFAGWFSDSPTPDTLISASRTLHFTMPTNPATDVTIRAKFVISPYVSEVAGSYAGLVQPANFSFEASGFMSMDITGTGAFTGRLIFGGQKIPLQGEFTAQEGNTAGFLGVFERGSGLTPVTLNLSLDTNPTGTRRIIGTANSGPVGSQVVADRAVYDKEHPAPQALVHDYTLYMPPASPLGDSGRDPHGLSVGTLKINAKGVVKWFGRLADRTVVNQTAALTKDGTWPLFLNLYSRGGVMLGVVTHAVQAESDLTASLDWFRPTTGSSNFPLGFLINDHALIGAMYTAPESGRVLPSFDTAPGNMGTITIDEGNLLNPITAQFLLKENNKVKFDAAANPAQIVITIDPSNGTFFGSFVHTISQKVTDIEGIVFQKTGTEQMLGSFLGKSQPGVPRQSGRVILEANPTPPPAP